MAEISHGRALTHFSDHHSQSTPGPVFHHNGTTLQPLQVGGDILHLQDRNPDMSTVRAIIREKILKYLSQKANSFAWVENREKLAQILEEKLLAEADSQLHHMNPSILENRLDDLLSDERKDAAGLVSSSSIGLMTWNTEVPHNMEASSPSPFYNNFLNTDSGKGASNTVHSSLLNTNLFTSSVLDNRLSASHRYLPNEHHRIVANVSLGCGGNAISWPERIPGSHIPQPVSVSSRHGIGGRHSNNDAVMSPEQYTGGHNNHLLNSNGDKTWSSMCQIPSYGIANELLNAGLALPINAVEANDGAAISEGCMESHFYGDMHVMPDRKSSSSGMSYMLPSSFGLSGNSEIMNPACMQSQLAANSAGAYSHSDLQTLHQVLPVSQSLVQSFHRGTQSHPSQQGHLLQNKQVNKGTQQSCQWSHLPQKQFDQLQLFQKDQYFQSESSLNGPVQMNGYILPGQLPLQPLIEQDVTGQQLPQSSIEKPTRFQLSASNGVAADCQSKFAQGDGKYHKVHKILLLYEHVMTCSGQEKQCKIHSCMLMKRNLSHILKCNDIHCAMQCVKYNRLFDHYRECRENSCRTCSPVRIRLKTFSPDTVNGAITVLKTAFPTVGTIEYKQPSLKRAKTEEPSLSYSRQSETSQLVSPVMGCTQQSPQGVLQAFHDANMSVNSITTGTESARLVSQTSATSSLEKQAKFCETNVDDPEVAAKVHSGVEPVSAAQIVSCCEQDDMEVQVEAGKVEQEVKSKVATSSVVDVIGTKLIKPKTEGVSLLDTFTPEQIREHIRSLEQCIGRSKANAEKVEGVERLADQNLCSLCGMDKLLFELPFRYCASCSKKINPKRVYYSLRNINNMTFGSDVRISFCSKCYNSSVENVKVGGEDIPKFKLEKKWNYAETEWWVQCDKCQAWQHQICVLFNGQRKEARQAEYTCPNCSLREIESGEREPLPPSVVPGAKDLPTTMLSDHIEQWLCRRLKEERQERANNLGKNFDEVPGAEGLTVRVVSSVDKRLEVKRHFHELFKEEKYPAEFPYKSKAILLFQKIEGADVCLFGMYVQEYGSECACPNQRRVCISYIDSVKYFRPKITAVTGEALRTFVYHEILIGYLDYCKKRGFTSCHIWVCPSLKRDDYILYCHPMIQKMPKSDKLREWYQTMIRKATKQNVVMEHSNLYDQFFVPASECKAKVSAVRLPYFDSDYWPGEADVLLQREDESVSQKKGTKAAIERALRAARRDSPIGNSKDTLLMHQLGEIIRPMKEDFIMVYLQHTCKHCCQPVVSGKQWVCTVCKNFQLCEQCHCIEQNLEKKDRHPVTAREKHSFELVEVEKARPDTDDKDVIIPSEFFDTRTVFLSLCQGNQYQFDTLRRAKHSTMMILYHLHTPAAPALASSCTVCHGDIDTARSWHCMTCPDYDLCDSCYQREGAACHVHKLISHATMADSGKLQKKGAQKKLALQNVLNVLVHASECPDPHCSYPSCCKIKQLFHHSRECKTHASGGCIPCNKVWYLLQKHASVCKKLECRVPRCKHLKDYMRKKQQQSDFCRRAAKQRIGQQDGETFESSG
ncbi:histone acetyltransferase HAC1-like [Phoenix dactylifera]|uniref:histone acetyltransferase n=1 Tax=Phoenix dactylifera TaxID=42345 RepID=A0A8B7BYC1_PHODC|nr:histone acetyltransferase HAC1-like [Phoenix dactylifera]XP_038990323.1 histone acetyltransferase HAC1-like [Phoenix dactylifera]